MSRYIDVDALGIGRANPDVFIRDEYATGWNLAIEIIENAPTADVVEVVRCKDCKYFFNDCCNHLKNRIIHKVPYFGADYVYIAKLEIKPDHFCSYGIRMVGGTNDT